MGKTGTTQWVQVKGVKGQIRLVPKSEGESKTPGPNQRFKAGATVKKLEQSTGDQRGGGRGGRGGRRSSGRGGRGREMGTNENSIVRKTMRRPKVSMLGAKQKSAR
jgi:hypothetical protein